MTIEEILRSLENLKDYVNTVGKQEIDSIKAGIIRLNTFEPAPAPPPPPAPRAPDTVTPPAIAPSKPEPKKEHGVMSALKKIEKKVLKPKSKR